MVIRAGELFNQIIIQQLVAGSPQQLDTGEPDVQWQDFATVFAAVDPLPLRSKELFAAQQLHAEVNTLITIRYHPGIKASMRVVHGSDYYDILAVVNEKSYNEKITLVCKTGLNDG